jgi:hypothetical protein
VALCFEGAGGESFRSFDAATLLATPLLRSRVASKQAARYLSTSSDKSFSLRFREVDKDKIVFSNCENNSFDIS